MSEQAELKECPFCGGEKFTSHTQNGDERIGYNIIHTITCSTCGCSKSAGSKQDKNGWCVEGSDVVKKRAMNAWNVRSASVEMLKADRNELIVAIELMLLHVKPAKMNAVALNHAHQVISKYKVKP